MIEYNVSGINSSYDFVVRGASYAGKPVEGTVMYITKKVEHLLSNLVSVKNCLVFIETGMNPSTESQEKNCFVTSDNPQMEYAKFITEFENARFEENKNRKYSMTSEGYLIGEEVIIGSECYIEPGCVIGHGVVIGNNARILSGATIKNAIIGDDFVCGENAVVGANGFTMAEDENGNKIRIPTLGKVIIGNNVEVGALDNISCGSAGDTIIEDFVKLDALVHVGHDVYIEKNAEITAGCIIGGFDHLKQHVFMGINSATRNRITLGENCIVGMGSVVTKSMEEKLVIVGNPARELKKQIKE